MSHSQYPTPPPTSSPKDHITHDHVNSHEVHHTAAPYHSYSPPNLPQRESYFNSYNAADSQQFYAPPPRINPDPKTSYANQLPRPNKQRPYSPRPIYYSPTNRPPSPYNASRPKPRQGYVKRMTTKIEDWVRGFVEWAKKHPIKAGIATFLPLLAVAGFAKAVHGIVRLGGELLGSMHEDRIAVNGKGDKEEEGKKLKQEEKKIYGWGMDHFVGFGGTKEGPVAGMLKILQMLVNHYCKLSPSMVPRLGSILLELYFLEKVQ